ncbi:TPR-like protein [Auriscalpium vulgare]|uniref:TPR-like protein n=1 Tax=Auriscalpium vulgare TaxID=40419 RepID=A0ACB8R343_9AGAM|nr:TPR-like protein [Auriscalpium vulgare]
MYEKARDLAECCKDYSSVGNIIAWMAELRTGREYWKGALDMYYEALRMHKLADDTEGQANDYLCIGQVFFDEYNLTEAKRYCNKSLKIYQRRALENIGKIYSSQDRFAEAEKNLRTALEIQIRVKASVGQATALDALGLMYLKQNKLEDAKYCIERALQCHKLRDDIVYQAYSIQSLAGVAARERDNDGAVALYKTAYDMHGSVADLNGQGSDLDSMAEFYYCQAQYDDAQKYWQQALKIAQKSHILYLLGKVSYDMRQHSQSREYWQLSLQKSSEIEYSMCEGSVSERLAELEIISHNPGHAIELCERANQAYQRADFSIGQERVLASLAGLYLDQETPRAWHQPKRPPPVSLAGLTSQSEGGTGVTDTQPTIPESTSITQGTPDDVQERERTSSPLSPAPPDNLPSDRGKGKGKARAW